MQQCSNSRLVSGMCSVSVFRSVTRIVKRLITLRTCVGFLSGMGPEMCLEVLHTRVRPVATLVLREGSCVGSCVGF